MNLIAKMATAGVVLAVAVADNGAAQASPRDTVRAAIGGATVFVDYGRPSMRGRDILGGLVPYDAIWRTGANAATTLVTDKPLMIGGAMIPAGTFTVYTVPGKEGWKLVINKQTGQWGTEYHEDQDLVRVDMKVEGLAAAVEQFTIKLIPTNSGGTLRLEWDKTAAVVPIMVH